MITALATPESGRVILDSNNTVIKIQSTNGEGHYFRAKIFVDGNLFDEQGWSRSDAFTATKDLKKLYNAYFEPVFDPAFTNQLTEQVHLKKLVAIFIEEYNIDSGELVDSLELPTFFIMYNTKPADFLDTSLLRTLGMDASVIIVPKHGKVTIPFYVNQSVPGIVKVKLVTNFGTVLDERSVNGVSGKKVFLYQFDLSDVFFSYDTLWIRPEITIGTSTNFRIPVFKINRLPDYPVKELAYLNNFGFFQYAYFDGEMETENGFTAETYDTADGREVVYEINEKATYTINTGSFLQDEKAIINMVANSHDTRLRNGSAWLNVVTKIKKQQEFKDRKNNYSENLQFTMQKGIDIANTGMIATGSGPDIVITNTIVTGGRVDIYFTLHNGYSPSALRVQMRTSPSAPWNSSTGSPLSPRFLNLPPGTYQVRVTDPNEIDPVSTIHNVTV